MSEPSFVAALFALFDADSDGALNFWEAGDLSYACTECSFHTCDRCGVLILGNTVYICLACNGKREWPVAGTATPFFCSACLELHGGGVHDTGHSQSPTCALNEYTLPLTEWSICTRTAACRCCGRRHSSGCTGYVGHLHMERQRDGSFVCEWCLSSKCCRCGKWVDLSTPTVDAWMLENTASAVQLL